MLENSDVGNKSNVVCTTNITMENHHFSLVNQLFLLPFSMAMFVYQRVVCTILWLTGWWFQVCIMLIHRNGISFRGVETTKKIRFCMR